MPAIGPVLTVMLMVSMREPARSSASRDVRAGSSGSAPPGANAAILSFLVAGLAIRLVLLGFDAQPRFFLGDSESYLATRLAGYLPNDRSWLYGLIAVPLVSVGHGFVLLLLLQLVAGALVSALVAAVAISTFGSSRRVGWILLVLTSLEPLSLYYERSVLTDTLGLAAFWISTWLLLGLGRRATVQRAALLAGATLLAVALRTIFVPHALLVATVSAWYALRSAERWDERRACVLAAVLVLCGLRVYAVVTGAFAGVPAALNPRSGAFFVGLVAPVLAPSDFAGSGLRDPAVILASARSSQRWRRSAQAFDADGVFSIVERELGDWRTANEIAKAVARRAALRDPAGVARVGWETVREYQNERLYHHMFERNAGLTRPLPAAMVASLERMTGRPFNAESALAPSLVSRWWKTNLWLGRVLFIAGWSLPLLVLPLAARLLPDAAGPLRILALVSLGYVATIALLSLEMAPRFLMPLVPCVAILSAAVTSAGWRRFRSRLLHTDTPDRFPRT